ncbi:MAG: NAD(P)/FAD-dependent oxidoreductase [Syntrophales bacterium]
MGNSPFMNSDCVVIGADLTGLFAALYMADNGVHVTVIDAKTPQTLLNDLKAEIFLFRQYSLDVLEDLRKRSRILCQQFTEKTSDSNWIESFSQLDLVVSGTDVETARAECERLREHGEHIEFISQAELRKINSAINPDLFGAILHHDVAAIEGERLYRSLWQACDKEKHINLFWETRAAGIDIGKGTLVLRSSKGPVEAKRIVLTAGIATPSIISSIGIQLPVIPERQYRLIGDPSGSKSNQAIVEYKLAGCDMQRDIGETDSEDPNVELSITLSPDKPTSAGYGKEFAVTDLSSQHKVMNKISHRIKQILPGYSSLFFNRVVSWFEPVIADGIPISGPAPNVEGLYLTLCPRDNKGLLVPAMGELAARWIMTGEKSEKTKILSPERFPQTAPGGKKQVKD